MTNTMRSFRDSEGELWTPHTFAAFMQKFVTGHGRWTPKVKEIIVQAIHAGLMTEEEASTQFACSPDELLSWKIRFWADGRRGLKLKANWS